MFQLTSTTTSLTVSTLQPFTTYFCIIAASTSVGMGPFSTVVTLQTPEDGTLVHVFRIDHLYAGICRWNHRNI